MKRLSIGLSFLIMAASSWADIQRTADGRPDLSGTYNVSTLTPLQRPEEFGENLFLTEKEAAKIADKQASDRATAHKDSDPDRTAPPAGGDGSPGAAGNVGGYNLFWIDNGERAFELDGKFRTSIITHPKNGRQPTMTAEGQQRVANFLIILRENTGSAWWLDRSGPGPYDNMEMRPNGERCLLSFGSTSGPPMLPSAYNNLKRIVQTDTHVMILAEMIHDARVIRLNSAHRPTGIESWMGDSIGHWDGDTLIVDTTNFGTRPALLGANKNLHVVERFSRMENGDLKYSFTVDNPDTWEASWGGEYPWPATRDKLYEYACHEGNYALGNIMRGARLLEQDIEGARAGGEE